MARAVRKFNEAITAATRSTMAAMHGAVVVQGGKTLASGCNSLQPLRCRGGSSMQHAETAAMRCVQHRSVWGKLHYFEKPLWLRCLCCPNQIQRGWVGPHS
jgi:hypothetical protein